MWVLDGHAAGRRFDEAFRLAGPTSRDDCP